MGNFQILTFSVSKYLLILELKTKFQTPAIFLPFIIVNTVGVFLHYLKSQ